MKVQRTWQSISVSILLALVGLGMLGFWTMWLVQGNLVDGIHTGENNQLIVFHVTAEAIAALFALVGAVGLAMRREWGRPMAFIAGGMVIYATINSRAHSVKNDPALTPIFVVSLVVVLICFPFLWSERMMTRGKGRSVVAQI